MSTLATSLVPVDVLLEAAAGRRGAGKLDEARALYGMVLASEPDNVIALRKAGAVELASGRLVDAATLLSKALQLDPDHAACQADLAVTLARLGHPDQAEAGFDRAVALQPGNASILFNRGTFLASRGRLEAALADFDRATTFLPTFVEAWVRRADVLKRRGQADAALQSLARAAELAPGNGRVQAAYGDALYAARQSAAAAAAYERALAVEPGQAAVWSNLGMCRLAVNRAPAALEALDQAVRLDPGLVAAHANRGLVLRELLRVEEALESFKRALALDPRHPAALANMGVCQLLMGRFAEGWRGHEERWKIGDGPALDRHFTQPLWLGEEDVAGKTILLHAEQGFGDTLHFCRYAPLLKQRGARVVLEVQPALKTLMQSLDGVDVLLARGEPLPDFDLHCPLMSLPLAFGTDERNIPAWPAYLAAPADRLESWRARLGPSDRPRVGVVWFGKPSQHNDHNRSVPLAKFVRALPDGVEVHSLLDRVREDEAELLAAHPEIRRHDTEIGDFADTAALATCMDLVVSVCTSTAHLAAALGRPTWILLPYSACWRWRLDREESPWYPSVRLFRQPALGDWRSVMDRVRPALEQFARR